MEKTNIKETFNQWRLSLSIEEKEALKKWTTEKYKEINETLLDYHENKGCLEIEKSINLIDSALSKFHIPFEISVYRSEGALCSIEDLYDSYSIVKKITIPYKTFVATSILKTSATRHLGFLRNLYLYSSFIFLEGEVETGVNCGFLCEDISAIPDENEILLMRNITYCVNKFEMMDSDIIKLKGKFQQMNYNFKRRGD